MTEPSPLHEIRLRYDGRCATCARQLERGTFALHDRETKTVTCLSCSPGRTATGSSEPQPVGPAPSEPTPPSSPLDRGTPGASAAREHERRVAKREDAIRAAHPRLGGLILALSDDPQSTKAWKTGASGETVVGRRLDSLDEHGVLSLHDRRIPRTRANIDHLAITPNGVYVVDAKRYRDKRPSLRVEGGFLRPRTEKLMVGSSDRSKLVTGVHKQVVLVRDSLEAHDLGAVPVRGVLCFVEADWPLLGGDFIVDGVYVTWPKKLLSRLREPGDLAPSDVEHIARVLADAFPRA